MVGDNGLKPKKPTAQPDIICTKCKKESGHTNESLRGIRATEAKKLHCQNCGKVAITVYPSNYRTT